MTPPPGEARELGTEPLPEPSDAGFILGSALLSRGPVAADPAVTDVGAGGLQHVRSIAERCANPAKIVNGRTHVLRLVDGHEVMPSLDLVPVAETVAQKHGTCTMTDEVDLFTPSTLASDLFSMP